VSTSEPRRLVINPLVKWGVHPAHQHQLRYVEGIAGPVRRLPEVGEVLTLEFIVDATTGLPCPVRVCEIQHHSHATGTLVVPVLLKHQPD